MDELQLVRELFDERPPPRPEVIAEARARLAAPAPRRQAWLPPGVTGRAPRRPARRRPGRRLVLGAGVPIAAAATAAAVAAAVVLPGSAGAPPVSRLTVYRPASLVTPSGAVRSGPGVLLAAARTVARNGAAPVGRYWETSSTAGNFVRVGPAGDQYVILARTAAQTWDSRDPQALSQAYNQPLGVQLASAADRRAWRRDGSPGSWNVDAEIGLSDPAGYSSGGGPTQSGRGRMRELFGETGNPFVVGDRSYSAQGLRQLPAGPAQLKALLLAGYQAGAGYGSTTDYLFETVPLVFELPVTSQVRAGLYRMLAGLPGVRGLGQVRDASGRRGAAVGLNGRYTHCGHWSQPGSGAEHWTFASCTVQQRLIINPATGQLLALELRYLRLPPGQSWSAPGGLFSFELYGALGWTNANLPPS
jgi:hypothetical protein